MLWALLIAASFRASAADLDPGMRARVAAIRAELDGPQVTEALVRRGDSAKPEALARKAAMKAAAAAATPFLDASVRRNPRNDTHMGIDGPQCFDGAPKLGLMLRALGFPVHVASAAGHVFLIATYPEVTLIVDPTVRQFLGQDQAPSWVPLVFVGTLSELAALYARDPGLPVLPYRKIYFDPEWPAYFKDGRLISERNSFLWSPNGQEYAPIRDYFNAQARQAQLRSMEKALPEKIR